MKVQLLVSEWCPSCPRAEAVWREAAARRAIDLEVVDLGQPEGRTLARALGIRTVPAVVVDGRLAGVGVPTLEEALALVAGAPERAAPAVRHVGLLMAPTARILVASGALHLVAAGAWLAAAGALMAPGAARAAPLHLFTLGFVAFTICGLGEHMLPRFAGRPIRAGALAWGQIVSAHLGLWLLAGGLAAGARAVALAGAALSWLALAAFAARVWPVLWPRARGN